MSAIGPGDFVECVDGAPARNPGDCGPDRLCGWLERGRVYRVRDVHRTLWGDGLFLAERETVWIDGDGDERAWTVARFRPIYRPSVSLIESLKTPAPEREPA